VADRGGDNGCKDGNPYKRKGEAEKEKTLEPEQKAENVPRVGLQERKIKWEDTQNKANVCRVGKGKWSLK